MSATDTRAEVTAETVADARDLLNRVRQSLAGHAGRTLTHALAARLIRHLTEAQHVLQGVRGNEAGGGSARRLKAEEREQLRRQVFALYGSRCACCGESQFRVLTIDHIKPLNGRRRSRNLYRRILSGANPRNQYQVLCVNCNLLKGTSERCPHEHQPRG